MFIDRIRLDSFGKIKGMLEFSRDRCNVICQDNEFGKSTIVDAILYTLYNFPAQRSRSGELRAHDKYRPWSRDGSGRYGVELELTDEDGRLLSLRACFDRQQPFELRDLVTHKALSLEGLSFGQRFLHMPARSFTECFFFRQDERSSGDREDLIHVIQEAAVSNRRGEDAPIRVALKALEECKVHFEEFSSAPIRVDNLIKRVDERLLELTQRRADLVQECEKRSLEIEEAESADREIERLSEHQAELEFQYLLSEAFEIEAQLARQNGLVAALALRQGRQRELERYARYEPSSRSEVQALYAEWKSLEGRLDDARRQLDERILARIGDVERDLAEAPPALASICQEDLDSLRSIRQRFPGQESAVRSQDQEVTRLRTELEGEGIPVDHFEGMQRRLSTLDESDHRQLCDLCSAVSRYERDLAEAQKHSSEACVVAAQARSRLERVGTLMAALVGMAAILGAVGAWLLMAKMPFLAAVFLLLAAAVAVVGIVHVGKRQQIARSERQPALAAEVAASAEVNRLLQALESARAELKSTSERVGLTLHELAILEQMDAWGQRVVPYRAAVAFMERLAGEFDRTCAEACSIVCKVAPKVTSANLDEQLLEDSCRRIEAFLSSWAEHQRLVSERDYRLSEIDTIGKRLAEKHHALELVLSRTEPPGGDLEKRVGDFHAGCENVVRLRAMIEGADPSQLLDEDEVADLRERLEVVKERIAEAHTQRPDLARILPAGVGRATLQDQINDTRSRREELRIRRLRAFNECDRAIETWRQEGPGLGSEIDRLQQFRADMVEFRDAVRLAHTELSSVSEEVFSEWAATLNRRANQILPLLNPNYEEIRFSEELDVSVYSHEAERRLDARELQHLSKGARDQLGLAVRVAISEYLSAHVGNLPMIFDEPFAHWDDARFAEGVRYLAELATRHQILVLSCHRSRYRSLGMSHPELAGRLNHVELQPLGTGK